jgi:hypothetical protein
MWANDLDNCEDFTFSNYDICNGGKVGDACPFTSGSDLNARYHNDPIEEIRATGENACVADGGDLGGTSGYGYLGTCPESGDGSLGSVFVVSSSNYLVNVYWSNLLLQQLWTV